MHLLLVEDDVRLAKLMKRVLAEEGHVVDAANDGAVGLDLAVGGEFDAIILDVMLPSIDGFEICRRLRKSDIDTPVLMLTARDAVDDRVRGLDAGADDYVAKPFAFAELLARLRALGRRRTPLGGEVLSVADLVLDEASHTVRRGKSEITLTQKEFALLEDPMRHPGHVLSRSQILDNVWGYEFASMTNVVDIYIHYLRRKIDASGSPRLIHTVRGIGYKIGETA